MDVEVVSNYKKYEEEISDLYIEAFPKSERKSKEDIIDVVESERGKILPILFKDEFAGFFITMDSLDKKTTLIDYFAIRKELRGKHIGSSAISLLDDEKKYIIEIERVDREAENFRQRYKRKNFYQACGFMTNDLYVSRYGVDMELLSLNEELSIKEYTDLYDSFISKSERRENIIAIS